MPLDGTPHDFETQAVPVDAPEIFSLDGLIAWLEKQPGEREYDFNNCSGECLIGRYLVAVTGCNTHVYTKVFGRNIDHYRSVAYAQPWTYGAALARARALRDSREALVRGQAELCRARGIPHFAPAGGVCWSCSTYLVAIYGRTYATQHVTGCPQCHRSYCD